MSQRAITSDSPGKSEHIRALDGLRGVAITLVFAFHLHNTYPLGAPGFLQTLLYVAERGAVGVDIFFVLSGFLITSILMKARGSNNFFKIFYARRSLRIFPLYYLALSFVVFRGSFAFWYQFWFWINCSNVLTAFYPFAIPVLTHFWTLAIEEQFYLLWPFLIQRFSNQVITAICLIMIPLQYLLRVMPATLRMDAQYSNFSYRLTPFHSEGLFVGALLAIWMMDRVIQRRHLAAAQYTALISFAVLVILLSNNLLTIVWLNRAAISVVSILSAALITIVTLNPRGRLSSWLAYKPLALVGRYSFCMYVIHLAILQRICKLSPVGLQGRPWGFLLAAAQSYLLTFLIAAVSWRVVEEPLLGLKRLFVYKR